LHRVPEDDGVARFYTEGLLVELDTPTASGSPPLMPFPPDLDATIRKRFDELVAEGAALIAAMRNDAEAERRQAAQNGVTLFGEWVQRPTEYQAFRTKVLNLVEHLGVSSRFAEDIRKGEGLVSDATKVLGILHGLADDYKIGFLEPVIRRLEAEIVGDYLGQAELLLKEGQPGKFDHVPAAVLLGAVLEQSLRTLCMRQIPALPIMKSTGEKIMLNGLIDDLKKAGVYNELKAKQLRAWADVRNAAAHGEFTKFTRADVGGMQQGLSNFLADYL